MTVIARYKIRKVWMRMILTAGILLALPEWSVWMLRKMSETAKPHFYEQYALVTAWIFAIPVLLVIVNSFRQVVFHGSRLIWIEDGMVIWRDREFFSVPCPEIVNLISGFGGKFNQLDTITFQLRSGSEKVIATDSMSEDCEVVVARLKSALGLKSPDEQDQSPSRWHQAYRPDGVDNAPR